MPILRFSEKEIDRDDIEHLRDLVRRGMDPTGLIGLLITKLEEAYEELAPLKEEDLISKITVLDLARNAQVALAVYLHRNTGGMTIVDVRDEEPEASPTDERHTQLFEIKPGEPRAKISVLLKDDTDKEKSFVAKRYKSERWSCVLGEQT